MASIEELKKRAYNINNSGKSNAKKDDEELSSHIQELKKRAKNNTVKIETKLGLSDVDEWYKAASGVGQRAYSYLTKEGYKTKNTDFLSEIDDYLAKADDVAHFLRVNKEALVDFDGAIKSHYDTVNYLRSLKNGIKSSNNYYSKFKDEASYNRYQKEQKLNSMSSEELKAEQKNNLMGEDDKNIIQELMRSNMPYNREYALQDGRDMGIYDEIEQKRKYISEKYGIKFTESSYENDKLLTNLMNGDTIAYTTMDGRNVTWDSLYNNALLDEDLESRLAAYSKNADWAEKSKVISTVADTESDYQIVAGLSRTLVPYDWETAEANGIDRATFDEVEKKRQYIKQKYGVDLHSDIYNDINTLNDIMVELERDDSQKDSFEYMSYLTPEEMSVLSYIYENEGRAAALDWHNSRKGIYLDRYNKSLAEGFSDVGKDAPFWGSVGSVALSLGSGVEYLTDIFDYMATGEPQSNSLARASSSIRSGVSETVDLEIGNWDAFDFVYNTGMSMADSATAMALPGSSVILGLSAAAQATNDALDRGMSQRQAFWNGLASGVFEGLFEKWSIGEFKALKEVASAHGWDIAKNIAKSMLTNASEETATEIANLFYDDLINGDFSQYETMVRQYVVDGTTESEAKRKVALELGGQVLESGASGALMGFGFGAIGSAGPIVNNTVGTAVQDIKTGKSIIGADGGTKALENLAMEVFGADSRITKQAKKATSETATGKGLGKVTAAVKNISNQRTVGKLYRAVSESTVSAQDKENIAKSLEDSGFSPKSAKHIADALAAKINGKQLTNFQQSTLDTVEGNKKVKEIVNNLYNDAESPVGKRSQDLRNFKGDVYRGLVNSAIKETIRKNTTAGQFTPTGKYEVSDKGKAINTETGDEIDIKGVSDISKGEMVLKLADGTTIDAKSVSFASNNDALIYEAIANLGDNISAENANKLIAKYDGSDAEVFARGIAQAYTYGFYGIDRSELTGENALASELTKEQRNYAYGLGEQYRSVKDADDKANAKTIKAPGKKGVFYRDKDGNATDIRSYLKQDVRVLKEMQTTGIEFMEKMSKMMGVRFNVFESWEENGKRYYLDENGKVTEGNPNGFYDPKTGEIYIALDAGSDYSGTMLFTVAHELTHFMRQWSPEHFTKISKLVFSHAGFKGSVSSLVADKMNGKRKLDYDTALEEVVADGMETILKDGKVAEFMVDVKKTDSKLWAKLKEWFKNFAEFLKKMVDAYSGQSAHTVEGQKVANFSKKLLNQIEQIWAEGAVVAGENYKAALENVVEANAEAVPSDEIITDGAVVTDGEGTKFSIKSMKHDIADGQMFEDLKTYCGWTQQQVDELRQNLENLVDYMTPNRDILDMNETYGMEGRRFSPYKPNSDPLYKISMDFSTLCSKRLLTQYVIENLQLRENRPMSAEEQMAIRDMLNEYRKVEKGLQVACAMCYVEAARLKSPKQIQRWLDDPAPLLRDYFGKKNKEFNDSVKEAQADFKESRGYARNAPKKDMKPADVKELNKIGPKMRSKYQLSAEEQAIIDKAKTLPNSVYLTAGNLSDLSETDPVIYDAYTAFVRTATRSKSLETDEPYYYGDSARDNGNGIIVSDSFIEAVNRENGMRFSSWSDWRIQHLLDYITAVIDNSVRGAAMHGYTKFGEEVRVLGKTGMMFNMSGVAGTQTGLNEDGSLSFSPTESMDVNEAIQLRDEFPETAGLQCIGVSDAHIIALLRSDIIDYVIPYHVSGLNAALRRMADIYGWADYTGTQHASIDKSIKKENAADPEHWHEEPVFSEFFVGYDTGMSGIEAMRASAERYKQMCKGRGLTPKFNQFANEANYWKLLIDRKMINQQTGDLIRQKAVTPTFEFDTIKGVVDRYVDNYDSGLEARALNHIVENWDSIPKRIKDLKKQGGTKAKKTKKAVDTLANQTLAAQPTTKKSERVSNTELAAMDETALYIKNTDKANYIGMIFNGTKTEETRSRRTLDAFIGKDFYVTDGKYVYGSIVLGEPHKYTEAEFRKLENRKKHRVPTGDEYDIKPGGIKWAYPIESYKKFAKPKKLSDSTEYKNSFQARQVLYSGRENGEISLAGQETVKYSSSRSSRQFFRDNVFPPYKTSHSDSHEYAERWARSEEGKKERRRLFSHYGKWYVVEVVDNGVYGYRIVDKLDDSDYKRRAKNYGKNGRYKSSRDAFDKSATYIRGRTSAGGTRSGVDSTQPGYRGEDPELSGVDEQQIRRGEIPTGQAPTDRSSGEDRTRGFELPEKTRYLLELGAKVRSLEKKIKSDRFTKAKKDEYRKEIRKILEEMRELSPDWRDKAKMSDRDTDYLDAVNRGDTKTAQKMVDEAAMEMPGIFFRYKTVKGERVKVPQTLWHYSRTVEEEGADAFSVFAIPAYFSKNQDYASYMFRDGFRPNYEKGQKAKPFYITATRQFNMPNVYGRRMFSGQYYMDRHAFLKGVLDENEMYHINEFVGDEKIVQAFRDAGYDLIYDKESGYDTYIVLNANQIKSAEPVTYDDSGNVIPLSERFNTEKDDIRYSDRDSVKEPFEMDDTAPFPWEHNDAEISEDESIHDYARRGELENYKGDYKPDLAERMFLEIINDEAKTRKQEELSRQNLRKEYDQKLEKLWDSVDQYWFGLFGEYCPYYGSNDSTDIIRTIAREAGHNLVGQGEIQKLTKEIDKVNRDIAALEDDGKNSSATTLYQDRIDDSVSNRALLANAFEGIAKPEELPKIQEYKDKVALINAEEKKLRELNEQIKELSFAKGPRDTKTIRSLQFEARQTANRINTYDKQLLRMEASEPLQKVLNREKKLAYKKAEQRGKEALAEYKAKVEAQQKETAEKWRESRKTAVAKARETADKRDARAKLQKLVLDTVKWISYPAKTDVKCPDILKKPYEAFLQGIDLSSKRLANGGEATKNDLRLANAMDSLATAIDRVMLSQDPSQDVDKVLDIGYLDLPADFVQKLRDMTESIKSMMVEGEYVVNTMTAEEVRKLSQMIRTLNHSIKTMSNLYANLRFANVEALGIDTMDFLDAVGEIEKTGGMKDFVQWDNALPFYAFKRFGKGGESVFEGLMDAQDKLAFLAQDIFDFQEKTWTGKEAKEWSEDTHTIKLPHGSELTMTTADAMSIYCLSRREQALPHLLGGGVRVMGIQKGSQKAKDSRSLLTIQDVEAIISSLTDRQKQVAEGIQEFMSTVCSEWGNEISMKRFLTREFTEKFYFPIESNDENLAVKDPAAQQSDLFRLLNISATKPLTQGANNEVIIRNIFDVFTGHASDMARLNAYGMGLLDYMKWLNYRVKTTNNENQIKVRGVRKSMEKAYGKAANSYVLNLIKDVNGRPSDGGDPNILMKWMRSAKTASVGSSIRVATLQITSYPRAALVLSPKSLSLGLTKVPNIKRAKEYCGIALWKSFGFYDTNISRSIEDQMKGVKDVKQKLIELSLKGAEWGDAITWGCLWNACEYEVAKTTKNKVGSEEFYQEVGKKLREVVYRTQVVDSNLTRSQIMRSKRGMAQEAAAFMSEPTLSANILMDAGFEFSLEKRRTGSAKSAWSKTGAYIGRAIAVYSIGQLTAALMEGLWDAWRDEDDEEFWKKYLSAFAENLALDLVPFNKIPIVSDVFEGALSIFGVGFYSSDKMSTTWLTQAVSAVDAWKDVFGGNSSATVYNALYKTLRALSSCYGVSFSGLLREGVALWNNTAGAFDPMLKILTYDRSKAELGDMLLDALIAGDARQADSIRGKFADEDGSQSALRTAIKDRLESGDIDSGTANQYLVNYGGVKVADAYWMVKEWSFNGDAGDDFGKYDSFYTAVETGKDLKAVIKEYTDNGVTVETLKTQITDHFKPLYIEMSNSEKAGIKGYLLNAMTVLGMEREDAEEKVQEWEFEGKYGFSYSDRAEAYKSGKVSANELKTILMNVGGKTAEEADLQIEAYNWEKDGHEDVTMAAVRDYDKYCAASDVPKDVYLHIRSFANNTENDKDANGKTIYYSAMRKIMAEIDEQYGLTASQKTAIARSLGWAEKNISKYKLW